MKRTFLVELTIKDWDGYDDIKKEMIFSDFLADVALPHGCNLALKEETTVRNKYSCVGLDKKTGTSISIVVESDNPFDALALARKNNREIRFNYAVDFSASGSEFEGPTYHLEH